MKIAIVGAGVSGNLAARLLATRHNVVLFEASDYPGGHTNTVEVATPNGIVPVDTGFMVFNHLMYPNFCRMLKMLGVDSQPSDMSFSVRCDATGLEYNGSSLNALFSQRSNLVRLSFYRFVRDVLRFNRAAKAFAMARREDDSQLTLGEFLSRHGLGRDVRKNYLIPMLAAIWSAAPNSVEQLPARFILGFMHNHRLIQLRGRPLWRTIVGGAKHYVTKLLQPLGDRVRLGTPIAHIERCYDGVTLYPKNGSAEDFDAVVLATHADQALAMLANPTNVEHEILTALPYQANTAVLHSDTSQMPTLRRAWASWNYRIPAGQAADKSHASVTYDLNRLQRLPTNLPIYVTLNPRTPINPDLVHRTFRYQHPAYDLRSIDAQNRWAEINSDRRTWYCGAYWGYGFHEDGINSALRVAGAFGISLNDLQRPVLAACYATPAAKAS